jgi:hypothetical protein
MNNLLLEAEYKPFKVDLHNPASTAVVKSRKKPRSSRLAFGQAEGIRRPGDPASQENRKVKYHYRYRI